MTTDLTAPFPDLPPPDILLTGRFEPAQARRYVHLPFEVFPGVAQVHVRYAYSHQVGSGPALFDGNTMDIGLFDDRGIAPGSPGFRGWSGSNKMAFTIDRYWATPPYAPGPIGAGTWHVLLGPYKVGLHGLEYAVGVWFNLALPPETRGRARQDTPAPAPRPPAEPGWYRGDLHCHTLHSDGDSWPEEVLSAAAEAGLDFLGVTDHNTVSHLAGSGPGGNGLPLVVPGIEVTTYGGHWNVWGASRWYDFRDPSALATTATMREAIDDGGLVAVCHPRTPRLEWTYMDRGFHAVEVWNGDWRPDNAETLAWWDSLLTRGDRVVAVGGSDTHRLRQPARARLGRPTTWVQVDGELTVGSVLAALGEGRSFVSVSPAGPRLYLDRDGGVARARVTGATDARLVITTNAGVLRTCAVSGQLACRAALPAGTRYVRAHLEDTSGVLALTNPLWVP
jgi:predicted metal-dependent phosphoesterase TrpH